MTTFRFPARDALYVAMLEGLERARAAGLTKDHDIALCTQVAMDSRHLIVRYRPTSKGDDS